MIGGERPGCGWRSSASMEAQIVEQGTPATARTLPPNGAVAPREMTPALLLRYGVEILPGPDPLRPDGG